MSWSEVVHENRKRSELQRAREELRLRRRGYAVEAKPCADIPAVLTVAGVLTAAAWWRKEGRKQHGHRDWKSLPVISHILDFLESGSQSKRAPTRSKSKPKAQLANPSKAAAARQAAGRPAAAAGPQRAGSSGGSSAAAAAGAAALARAAGGGSSSSSNTQAPPSSTSSAASQQSKAKKKKNKKKK